MTGTVRAPGGPGANGAGGVPWSGGANWPGKAELGTPGLLDREDECQQLVAICETASQAEAAESKVRALERLLARVW